MTQRLTSVVLTLIASLFVLTLTAQDIQLGELDIEAPVRYLALGDSYTIGQSVSANERWPIQLRDSLSARGIEVLETRIIATTGWRTDNLHSAISNKGLDQKNYNLVSLLIGVNDQYQGRPIALYEPNFRQLLDSCLRYAAFDPSRVFVVSIPDYAYTPFGERLNNSEQVSAELDQYNAINKRVAQEYGVRYFNITPISRLGLQDPDLVASDQLHPSGYQYTLWVRNIMDYLDSRGLTRTRKGPSFRELQIYPVPARQSVRVDGLHTLNFDDIRILNVQGQAQSFHRKNQDGQLEVDVSRLAAGTYVLQLFHQQKLVAKGRFIVQ